MKRFLVILLTLFAFHLQAQVRVGEAEAYSTAEQFVWQQGKQNKPTLTLSEEIKSEQSGQTNLFVFSMEPKGFVIVSALDEVLAYSFESSIPALDELPDHVAYWIDLYNEQTDYLLQHPDRIKKPEKQQHSVGPLLTSIWGQGCYHNAACPQDGSGPCRHVSAGCVAIAMAQIMYYHKQPQKGSGSMTYRCPPYGTLSADFGHTIYHWEDMVDTVDQNNAAVAKLISHCGISVQMIYGPQSSTSSSTAARDAFQQFFFYPFSTYLNRYKFTDEEWTALIRQNLEDQYPVYYEGKSGLGTHAFVCDGFDNNGLFHFNFGWDGVADGYYTLNRPYGFSVNQTCIHNIIPLANFPIQSDSHGIIYVTPDGIGDGSSWENATSNLQAAIYKSNIDNATIWVKEGTYTGETTDEHVFNLFGDCHLYGGFKGDEPYDYDLSLRDFEAHPSILDGNHSNGVLKIQFAVNPVLIDGFTIQNGVASQGGGILAKCQTCIRNCKFRFNYSSSNGGGLSQRSTSSGNAIIEDCEFYGNEARTFGGAVCDWGNATFLRCHFSNNTATYGGGIYCKASEGSSQFISCTISNNTAINGGGVTVVKEGTAFWSCLINNNTAETGGGFYLGKEANLYNCTIVKNEAQSDYGGVYVSPSSPQNGIQNCIIWGNLSAGENPQIGPPGTYSYCAVEGDLSDADLNFKAENDNDGELPRFYIRFQNPNVEPGIAGQGGNWRLQSNSLCINKGTYIPNQSFVDLDGNPRWQHGNTDLGAYETNVATEVINAYLCEINPYYYQDSLLSELGTYSFLHHGNLYDSLIVIQMQNPPPAIFFAEEICEDEMYDFFGTLLNTSGTYYATIDCITYQLDLTVHSLTYLPTEAEICEGETYNFFGMPLKETGVYSTTFDCQVHQLNLNVKPSLETYYSEKTICEGETYNFHGIMLNHEGHYQTTVDCRPYELELTVNPKPKLQCSNDTVVGYGHPAHLAASGADSYLWSTGDTTQYITVYPVADQKYTVQGFSKNGCSDMAQVTVMVTQDTDDMILYPNPANDKVEIYMPLIDEVEVFNFLGVRMDNAKTEREVVELDVSNYPPGVYVVHARQLNKHHYKKLVIQH